MVTCFNFYTMLFVINEVNVECTMRLSMRLVNVSSAKSLRDQSRVHTKFHLSCATFYLLQVGVCFYVLGNFRMMSSAQYCIRKDIEFFTGETEIIV